MNLVAIRTVLPIGEFKSLNANPDINFQLNRFLIPEPEPLFAQTGARIKDIEDQKTEFLRAAATCEQRGEYGHAAGLFRAAEFFMRPSDPGRMRTFEKFIDLFYRAETSGRIERFQAPYGGGRLHGLRLPSEPKSRGTVVLHGGIDSYLEEFRTIAEAIALCGYDVIMFDGPGQGSTLMREGMPLTPEWEKPVAAVLDHFALTDLTLVGISLGGGLALRAAAFEPRIRRVIACDIMLDLLQCVTSRRGKIIAALLQILFAARLEALLDLAVRSAMARDAYARWGIEQGMHVTGCATPHEFFAKTKAYDKRAISRRVRQDVLIMVGAEDHLEPLSQFFEQLPLLAQARSVTGEIFTRADQAQSHCQIGNIALAVWRIAHWIETHS